MKVSDFNYDLPELLVAQTPVEPRDSSRLMVMNRQTGSLAHHVFSDIAGFINPGDVLVLNTTRVIPARLYAQKAETGGAVEILLLREADENRWHCLVGGRNVKTGVQLTFENSPLSATVEEEFEGAERLLHFSEPVNRYLYDIGYTPLPPYIHTQLEDPERYQTVYSRQEGSAAAPTAGLHFTPEVLFALKDKGVHLAYCTLHIGLDTFKPVQAEDVEAHHIHSEWAELSTQDAHIINEAKLAGGRIIAVGTTTARTLESAAIISAGGDPTRPNELPELCPWRPVAAFQGDTRLFIYPGYRWRAVHALLTNFHLPQSTLLMMVSSFSSRENILNAYEVAKQEGYRFYSLGDAMFIQ
jgi:S-adenosylmethionine:tRNA ribosyltransferase-isomerase